MNKMSLIGALALLALVVSAGVYHWRSDTNETGSASHSQAMPKDAVRLDQMPSTNSQGPQWELNDAPTAIPAQTSSKMADTSDTSATTENVLGIEVRKDRNCTVRIVKYVTLEDGTQSPLYSCEPNEPKPEDIYLTYSNETLETMAYSDAHAAHVLSRRHYETDYDASVDYGLRSAALSGDTKPLLYLLMLTPQRMTNQQVLIESLQRRYVLSGVVQSMDADTPMHRRVTAVASNYEGDGINFENLNHQIENHVATLQRIRAEVGID